MNHPAHIALVERLRRHLGGESLPNARSGEVPSHHYTSRERFELERSRVFRRVPILACLESELSEPGSCVAVEANGSSVIVVRGDDGEIRAFANACRHRGTELLPAGPPCRKKAFVCPYHGWSYDLSGGLIHAPHAESFEGREASRRSLVRAKVERRHGLVWLCPADVDAASFLDPIEGDLAALGIGSSFVYEKSERTVRANWKLIIDAFLDGYHIRHLHRNTVYPFFVDACSDAEPVGHHIRAVSARRTLTEWSGSLEGAPLRELATPSYLLFPNVIVIVHPDYVSILVAEPLSPDSTRFMHTMLIPRAPETEREERHFQKSFSLIDEGVFLSEDLATTEAIQRGLATGANASVLFGTLEFAALWFHESLDELMSAR